MKELERISAYITQLENERAELNKQVDKLKEQLKTSTTATDSDKLNQIEEDIKWLCEVVKNNYTLHISTTDFRTKLVKNLATILQDRVDVLQDEYDDLSSTVDDVTAAIRNNDLRCPDNLDIRDEDKIRSLYEAVSEAVDKAKSADNKSTTPNDEVTVLRNYIKRLGTAVDWKYADQEEPWTDSQINELAGIIAGNHITRKNLDTMAYEICSITRELRNNNFGLYREFIGEHKALNTYNFECTHELAETIQKLSDVFIRSCEHLEVAISNLEVAQLCDLRKEIEDCREQVHAWIVKSGALRWMDHRH